MVYQYVWSGSNMHYNNPSLSSLVKNMFHNCKTVGLTLNIIGAYTFHGNFMTPFFNLHKLSGNLSPSIYSNNLNYYTICWNFYLINLGWNLLNNETDRFHGAYRSEMNSVHIRLYFGLLALLRHYANTNLILI